MLANAKKAYRKLVNSGAYRRLLFATDGAAAAGIDASDATREYCVLLCPPGSGNIGDAAMVESYLDNSNIPVLLVCQSTRDFAEFAEHQNVYGVVALRFFIRGLVGFRYAQARTFAKVVSKATHLAVVGADLMDGNYNSIASLSRVSATRTAVKLNVPARVLGFSFSDTPNASLVAAIRETQDSVDLIVRDPGSRERMRRLGIESTRLGADLVFRQCPAPAANRADSGYVVLNLSGLVSSRVDFQVEEFGYVVTALREMGVSIVFVPHVLTADRSDMPVCAEAFHRFGVTGDSLIDRALSPREVRELVRDARVVVTARMHLAVMALGQAVPAFTVATQGKVDGLYELFGLEAAEYAFEPTRNFGEKMASRVADADLSDVRMRVRQSLPRVQSLAARNFEQVADQ